MPNNRRPNNRRETVADRLVLQPRNATPSLAELEGYLAIDQHDLENVCRAHPELFYRVSKELVLAESRRDQLRQHCKEVDAEVEVQIRTDLERREAKLTDKGVEALRRISGRVKQKNEELLNAELDMSRWSALKEAFSTRGYMIRDLIQLYLANYYGSDMERGNRSLRAAEANHIRRTTAEMQERRERRFREQS